MEKDKIVNAVHFRWVAIFCLVTLVYIGIGIFYYRYESQRIENDKYEDISVIAKLKADSIQEWRMHRLADVRRVPGPLVKREMMRLLQDPANPGARAALQIQLNINRKGTVYADALFLDTGGNILLSDNPDPGPVDRATMKAIEIALKNSKEVMSDFFRDPKGLIYIDAVAPVPDNSGKPIAIVVLRSKAADFLFPLIQLWPTPSKTAETLLVCRDGDFALFLGELRHRSNTALTLRFPLTDTHLPAVQAVLGKYGKFRGKDYRKADVLAVTRPIPESPWSIVAKVDGDEILAEIKYRAWAVSTIVFFLILISAGLIRNAYRNRQEVVRKRAEEALRLANAYNRSLIEASLDPLVTIGPDGKITDVNAATEKVTGHSRTELIGTDFMDYFSEPDKAKAGYQKVFQDGFVHDYALEIRNKDGHLTPVLYNASIFRDEAGQVIGAFAAARDITERKRAEEELFVRNKIANIFLTATTDEEIYSEVLNVVLEVMESKYGVVGYIDEDGDFIVPSMSRHIWDKCQVPEKTFIFPRDKWGDSSWPRAIREKKTNYTNEVSILTPEGHINISRHISMPIIFQGEVIGLIQVANKETDYTEKDIQLLELLGNTFIAPILNVRLQKNMEELSRKRAEEEIRKLNRVYTMLSDINQAIVRIREPQALFEKICHIAIETGGFRMAWIGLVDESSQKIEVIAHVGGADAYFEKLDISLRGKPLSYCPIDCALREKRHGICNAITNDAHMAPCQKIASELGFRSSASFPLIVSEKNRGTFNLYAGEPDFFDEEELKLLDELAMDISFAMEFAQKEAERRQAEKAVHDSEAHLRLLIEGVTDYAIYLLDTGGHVVNWNAGAERLKGYRADEIIGQHFSWVFTPEDRQNNKPQHLLTAAEAMGRAEDEGWRVRKDGSRFWANAVINALRKEDGSLYGFAKITHDLTERKKAEDHISKLNAELEQRVRDRTAQLEAANKELEAFSYSVSHDLRAPLRAIDGFSRILLEDYIENLDEEGKRVLNVIRNNTQKMGQLIDDLLLFSRLGRQELRTSDIDMGKLAKAVSEELKLAVPERKLKFTINTLIPAQGDQAMIRQVFVNLLANAVKFTRPKERAVIEVDGRSEGNENVYTVKDNGVGFDMQYANKLFGVFQRLHSSEEFEGTGVGLAIVQRIIHRQGGRVWAEGKVGEGAAFYFSLPAK